ncbi:GNAT family N-acetyltransferase [Rossellomorea sp. GCM10028870]|uniref:GNAT family N-acetyltransferase n=1 Tax=Rossellomorea sp. GCM10028870 TaxID=3273426 RepID=UPI00366A667B
MPILLNINRTKGTDHPMDIYFTKLIEPNTAIIESMNQWENNPDLIRLTRPNKNQEELDLRGTLTFLDLKQRLEHHHIYLIHLNNQLIGEMNYMVDPKHLYKKEKGTAWIGITIGESEGRGKGIGLEAINYLEHQVRKEGLNRIELGVFEFNTNARKLYQKLGYKEIGRIADFTYWNSRMWSDIRMEKYLK